MHAQAQRCRLVLALMTLVALTACAWGEPAWLKKERVTVGTVASAPKGWYVYSLAMPVLLAPTSENYYYQTLPGVYRTSLQTFAPTVIRGTEQDYDIIHLDISDDGQWICYSAIPRTPADVRARILRGARKLFLVRSDGRARVEVPTQGSGREQLCLSGFYRKSPLGSELFYLRNKTELVAIQVDLTTSPPRFGRERVIARGIEFDVRDTVAVCGSHIEARVAELARNITIPDEGKGTAGSATMWQFTGQCKWGCNVTMSQDGLFTVNNPTHLGEFTDDQKKRLTARGITWTYDNNVNPDPEHYFQTEHEGFVVLPFKEYTAPTLAITDYYFKEALSVNWIPADLRGRGTRRHDVSEWYVSNHRDYVIGVSKGIDAPAYGVWLVHWPSNTWTLLTKPDTHAVGPALYVTDGGPVTEIPWRQPGDDPRPAAAVTAPSKTDIWPGATDGLLFKWEASNAENTVRAGDQAWTCRLQPRGRATYGRYFQMRPAGGAFVAQEIDERLLTACRQSGALTVEAMLVAADVPGTELRSIIACATDDGTRDFTLGQRGRTLVWRLRAGGAAAEEVSLGRVEPGQQYHIVITYAPGDLRCYGNGQLLTTSRAWTGDFTNWTAQPLTFGDDWAGGHNWPGQLEAVAIYQRVLSPTEVAEACRLSTQRLTGRTAPTRLTVQARLVEAPPPPTPREIAPYRQALAFATYQVTRIVAGRATGAPRIRVARWAVLDGQSVPEARTVGETCQLTLEPLAEHPELADQPGNDDGMDDLPIYMEVAP